MKSVLIENIEVHGDLVLGIYPEKEKETPGGIIIVEHDPKKPQIIEVVSVGEKFKESKKIEAGDHVIYCKYSEQITDYNGDILCFIHDNDILGIIKKRSGDVV